MKPYTGHSKVSLVLADVDGTLVTHDKILTPRAKVAVRNLRTAGIAFAITSGRPPLGMKMIVDDLSIDTIIAGFDGGLFVKPDLTVVLSRIVSRAAATRALELIRKHKLAGWLYTDTDWYVPDLHGPHVAREALTVKFEAKVAADFNPLQDRAVKIVGVSDDLEAVARCETAMRTALGDRASATRSQPYYLDVTHPEATKGDVVKFLSINMNIPEEKIATIGDMPNDVPMFNKSGLSIAMGNAGKEVQTHANFVSLSCEEEGFAYAIERYVLHTHPPVSATEPPYRQRSKPHEHDAR
jgi:Cof subfamily protein (haloacid dehalogenase superfamily)